MMRIGKVTGGPRLTAGFLAAVEGALVETAIELAGALADETRPTSREAGKKAVVGDIGSLFAGPGQVAAILRKDSRGKLAAWMDAIEQGAGDARLRQILRGTVLEGLPILGEPDARRHGEFLRSGHRRPYRPAAVVTSRAAHGRFIAERQARVGSARKGWRDAGGDLGGPGGGWVSGGRRFGSGRVIRSGGSIRVEISNHVPYARYLLGPGRRQQLVMAARLRAIARLRRSVGTV